jgi:hypothetical protein
MMTGEIKEEKKKCKYLWGDYKCSREALPGDEHCIFHSKDIEVKKDRFNVAFWKEFERQKNHEEEYNFTGFVFPGYISFVGKKFNKRTSCKDAKFSEEANFWGAQFSGEAKFRGAQFSGTADFVGAQFSGEKLYGLFFSLRNRGIKRIREGRYKIKDFSFHLGDKIAKEYPIIDRMTKDAWYLDDFKENHPVIYWIWWLFADCGRSFFRWAAWSFVFAIAFAFIYYSFYTDYMLNFQTVYAIARRICGIIQFDAYSCHRTYHFR